MHNFEVARAFMELADLLEFKEESFFKSRGLPACGKDYRRPWGTSGGDIQARRITENSGIGRNIAAK